jgi:hypothetical protein
MFGGSRRGGECVRTTPGADTRPRSLRLSGEGNTTDLTGHRRAAILAARDLERPFVVATDPTECTTVSGTAAQELGETVRHLRPFGPASEPRVIAEETADEVSAAFEYPRNDVPVDVVAVPDPGAVQSTLESYPDEATI